MQRQMQLAGSLPAQTNHGCHSHVVRPSLVPMRDLAHMVNSVRDNRTMGRGSAQWKDSTWDLGTGQRRADISVQVQHGTLRQIKGLRNKSMAGEASVMASASDGQKQNRV